VGKNTKGSISAAVFTVNGGVPEPRPWGRGGSL